MKQEEIEEMLKRSTMRIAAWIDILLLKSKKEGPFQVRSS